jgi:O-antigen ligase
VLTFLGAWLLLGRRAGPTPDAARLRRWATAGAGALGLLSLPLLPLLLARASLGAPLRLEQRSLSDRMRLNQAAVGMLVDRPVSGVGAGAFVVRLHQVAGVSLPLEPAHNLPLLLAAEMGGPGAVAVVVLAVALAGRWWVRRRAANPAEALMGAAVGGMLAVGLFDHYWWTMLPARLLLVTVIGLWVGWATPPENRARAGNAPPATQSAAPPRG